MVSGTRARHVAIYALLSSMPITDDATKENNEEEEETGGDNNDMDADRRWSILDRPMQWVEPVSEIENLKKSKKTTSVNSLKQTLIVDEIPSGFNAIPCKPVFFDIASNYIDFPDLDYRAGLAKKRKARGDTVDETVEDGAAGSTGIVGVAQNLFGWFSK